MGAFFLMDSMTCQLQLLSSVSVCLMANKFMVLAAVFFGLLLCGGSASGAYGRNDQAVLWAVLFEVVSGQRTEAVFVSVQAAERIAVISTVFSSGFLHTV